MSYEVEPEDLIAHASHLDGVTDRLNTALDAARTVSMDDSAYGLLCSFLPPIVNPMEEKGIEALNAAVEGVTTTAGNVRTAAEAYRETDRSHMKPLEQFRADAEGVKVGELKGVSSAGGGSSPASFSRAMPVEPFQGGERLADSTPAHQARVPVEPFQGGERQAVSATPAHQAEPRVTPMQQGDPIVTPARQGNRPV